MPTKIYSDQKEETKTEVLNNNNHHHPPLHNNNNSNNNNRDNNKTINLTGKIIWVQETIVLTRLLEANNNREDSSSKEEGPIAAICSLKLDKATLNPQINSKQTICSETNLAVNSHSKDLPKIYNSLVADLRVLVTVGQVVHRT